MLLSGRVEFGGSFSRLLKAAPSIPPERAYPAAYAAASGRYANATELAQLHFVKPACRSSPEPP